MCKLADEIAEQKALAAGSPFWILCATNAQQRGHPGSQELGVRYTWKGEDHLGGWPVQTDRAIP